MKAKEKLIENIAIDWKRLIIFDIFKYISLKIFDFPGPFLRLALDKLIAKN